MPAHKSRPKPNAVAARHRIQHAVLTAQPNLISGAAGAGFLAVPFDALRFQYASAVMAGLARPSILASGMLERNIDALEKLILGPLARQR